MYNHQISHLLLVNKIWDRSERYYGVRHLAEAESLCKNQLWSGIGDLNIHQKWGDSLAIFTVTITTILRVFILFFLVHNLRKGLRRLNETHFFQGQRKIRQEMSFKNCFKLFNFDFTNYQQKTELILKTQILETLNLCQGQTSEFKSSVFFNIETRR